MEVEVVMPVPAPPSPEFNFDSSCSSPYMTAPSSPQRFGSSFFFSAPTSPSFFRDLDDSMALSLADSSSAVPFQWEEKPGTPKRASSRANQSTEFFDDDFEFDFSGQLGRSSVSAADELFDGGKIRPLKPPPGYESGAASSVTSPRSPRSPRAKNRGFDFDPFQAAIEETRNREAKNELERRGRERGAIGSASGSNSKFDSVPGGRGSSRSLSPMRMSDVLLEQDDCSSEFNPAAKIFGAGSSTGPADVGEKQSYAATFLSAISFSKGRYKKWKLRDFLLFRSASEGRAPRAEQVMAAKYAVLSRRESLSSSPAAAAEEAKNGSFRSTESLGSSRRLRAGQAVSAHEMHYTMNRAAAEEMKRKTFLPYKQGLLGCLGFNPAAAVPDISRGIGSLTRG